MFDRVLFWLRCVVINECFACVVLWWLAGLVGTGPHLKPASSERETPVNLVEMVFGFGWFGFAFVVVVFFSPFSIFGGYSESVVIVLV